MSVKSKLEIIEEVAAYYKEDITRRGLDDSDNCTYYSEEVSESGENKICAVGYCLTNPKRLQEITEGEAITENVFNLEDFKPEYRVDDLKFWQELQGFHDGELNWSDLGLSIDGDSHLDNLRKVYAKA